MKILYILEFDLNSVKTGNIGGITSHVSGVIEAFYKRGDEVVFVSPSPVPFLESYIYKYVKLETSKLFIPKLSGLWGNWRSINFLIRKIKEEAPDIIYTRWPGNIFFYKIRKLFPQIHIIAECNTPKSMGKKGGIFNRIVNNVQDNQNLSNADVVSVVSKEIQTFLSDRFRGKNQHKIIVNPNGVNYEKFFVKENDIKERFKIPDKLPVIGFSGFFAPWHRIDILIRAVQNCKYNVRLLVIGKGPEKLENELLHLSSLRNKERIIFTGAIPYDEMPEFLSACDILVLPQDRIQSHRSPIKLFEYMAMGKPIAVANVGQLRRIIENGTNGLLFEPNVDDLVMVLEKLIKDKKLGEKLGKNAREDVIEKYSWEANVERILHKLNNTYNVSG